MDVRVRVPMELQISLIKTVFEVNSLKINMRDWLILKPWYLYITYEDYIKCINVSVAQLNRATAF